MRGMGFRALERNQATRARETQSAWKTRILDILDPRTPLASLQRAAMASKRLRLLLGGEWVAEANNYVVEGKTARLPLASFKSGTLDFTNPTLADLKGGEKLSPRAVQKVDDKSDATEVQVDLSHVDAWQDVPLPYKNPFAAQNHQVVTLPSARLIRVSYQGKEVASTTSAVACFEIGKAAYPLRLYIPNKDVHMDMLRDTDTTSHCPFKGNASYHEVAGTKDLAWYYKAPHDEVSALKNTICFYTEKPGFQVHIGTESGDILYPREGFGYTE